MLEQRCHSPNADITTEDRDLHNYVFELFCSHETHCHDGSTADLLAVVDFHNTRFSIGLTDQEKTDLVAFLAAL